MIRHQGYQVRGSTCHDIGLDDHRSNTQKSIKFAVKWLLGPKFSSPAARFKGLRLGGRSRQPRIGYPNRHHHPCMDRTTRRRPGATIRRTNFCAGPTERDISHADLTSQLTPVTMHLHGHAVTNVSTYSTERACTHRESER